MKNIKKFEDFMKESTENKGKGVGGDTDLFIKPSPRQTINRGDLDPLDNLGIRGRQITTDKIDGIIKSVKDSIVYVEDRLSKEIKEYSLPEFLKEFHKAYKKEKKDAEKTYESTINVEEVKQPELNETDKDLLSKILNLNEKKSEEKQLWEKKWENFAANTVKAIKEVEEDEILESVEKPIEEKVIVPDEFIVNVGNIGNIPCDTEEEARKTYQEYVEQSKSGHGRAAGEDVILMINGEPEEEYLGRNHDSDDIGEKKEIKIEKFSDFIMNRLHIKPDTIEEDINIDDIDINIEDELVENSVPKPAKTVECTDCGTKVTDDEFDKVRHLYSKHNYKPSADNLDSWLLEYFPPSIPEEKKKKK
jgi:hypothetical protein